MGGTLPDESAPNIRDRGEVRLLLDFVKHFPNLRVSVVRTELTLTLLRRIRRRRRADRLAAVVSRRLKMAVVRAVADGVYPSEAAVVRAGVESLLEVRARLRPKRLGRRFTPPHPAQTAFDFAVGG